MAVIQDIDAIRRSATRMDELADDAATLKDAAAEANPSFGTWGPLLGAVVGIPYSTFVSWQVESLLEDVPAAIEAHAVRLTACGDTYTETDEDIAAQMAILQTSLEEVAAAVTNAQIC